MKQQYWSGIWEEWPPEVVDAEEEEEEEEEL